MSEQEREAEATESQSAETDDTAGLGEGHEHPPKNGPVAPDDGSEATATATSSPESSESASSPEAEAAVDADSGAVTSELEEAHHAAVEETDSEARGTDGEEEPESASSPEPEATPATPAPVVEAPETRAAGLGKGVQVRRKRKQVYVSEIKSGQQTEGVFMVLRKSLPLDRNGKRFLALTLSDRTGRVEARLWDGAEGVSEAFQEGDYVTIAGQAVSYNGRVQIRLDSVTSADLATLDLPASEFISESSTPTEKMLSELRTVVGKIQHEGLRALVQSFIDDPDLGARFRRAPAAQSIHHAWIGGLLEHTLSVMRLCDTLSDHYPQVDRDLVLTGAFFHDFGKIEELTYEEKLGYSDAGRLVGHLIICCQWIHDRAKTIPALSQPTLDRITHVVASHHGHAEFGAARQPQTLEALIVHSADTLDARMSSWMELLEGAGPDGWTDYSRVYERQLFRGSAESSAGGTSTTRKKRRRRRRVGREREASVAGEPEEARREPRKEGGKRSEAPRTRPGGAAKERDSRARSKARPTEKEPKRESSPSSKKPTLTFNPFASLKERVESPAETPKEQDESGSLAPSTAPENAPVEAREGDGNQ